MKKADIAMIVLIASASIIISFLVAKSIFGDVYNGSVKVKTIEEIKPTILEPDSSIFSKDAINPTVPVNISGTSSNIGS